MLSPKKLWDRCPLVLSMEEVVAEYILRLHFALVSTSIIHYDMGLYKNGTELTDS